MKEVDMKDTTEASTQQQQQQQPHQHQHQPPLLGAAEQPAPPTTHHGRGHQRSFLALESKGVGPSALPIGGSSCHSREAPPHSPGTGRGLFRFPNPGVASEALIGSLRRRAHATTSKELISTPVGGLRPGECQEWYFLGTETTLENLAVKLLIYTSPECQRAYCVVHIPLLLMTDK
ncbi:unnamed protein product [Nyctereutes procyonoides]|uniref:(raccoon dog) hypothetical protein n=1 Tax=Nyctereutes procyonoides TaxID=34880 RepID=A0A811YWE1_NYCPR|nr:unnamed protein product [Nyctereutes procyonoides]